MLCRLQLREEFHLPSETGRPHLFLQLLDPSAMDADEEPRPSCSCKASRCIQRYCNCFGSRWYCSDTCICEGCLNTEDREAFVEERAELVLKKRPGAFGSKIAIVGDTSSQGKQQWRHVKGCNCRRSECMKMYCECFKNKVACTERCQCDGCGNGHGARNDDARLLHNNGNSGGKSDDGCGTPDGSNGTSNETAVVTDESSHSPTEAGVTENAAASGNPCDLDPGVHASNGDGLGDMLFGLSFRRKLLAPECSSPNTSGACAGCGA
ncbi:uncharacterized protein LOC133915594 [Phragmites australis]|uniref:uncharacterized protein LOC133915594 n=1 Tax=Phragmites australis TaxID=29695 RepID=UPI002D78274C|nr:uncharacterized protein LOC133915594 [Phragmites australis]